MLRSRDAENQIITRQTDFDHHVTLGHFFQEFKRFALVHDIHAVTDSLGARDYDRVAYVKCQTVGRHNAGRQFAGVQAYMRPWIQRPKVLQHLHLNGKICH